MQKTILVTLVMLAGCSDGTVEPAQPTLQITTLLSTATLRVGDSLSVRVTAKNVGTAVVSVPTAPCPSAFEILQGSTLVWPIGQLCTPLAYAPRALARGDSYVYESGLLPLTLAAGDYRVRGRVLRDGAYVFSPDIAIKIVAR